MQFIVLMCTVSVGIGLMLVCTVLTVRDVRAVIKAYVEDEALTSVSLNDDEPITFDPSPTIYLRMRENFVKQNENVSNDTLMHILETTFNQTKLPDTIPDLLFDIN